MRRGRHRREELMRRKQEQGIMGWSKHPFGTFLPALLRAFFASGEGAVLELGVGHNSTPVLAHLCGLYGRKHVAMETDPGWIRQMQSVKSDIRLAPLDWNVPELDEPWSVALVDQEPKEGRGSALTRLSQRCKFVVVHDVEIQEFFEPLTAAAFKYYWIDKVVTPWTGIYSNTFNVSLWA